MAARTESRSRGDMEPSSLGDVYVPKQVQHDKNITLLNSSTSLSELGRTSEL